MSTFAKQSFDAVGYALSRPPCFLIRSAYPPKVYQHILSIASIPLSSTTSTSTSGKDSSSVLVDLGCGPGLSTFAFVPHFDRVLGLDPSKNMVHHATEILKGKDASTQDKLRFAQGKGEDLSQAVLGLEDRSVDLVVAGQAAHWFDAQAVYSQLTRVLKPGGSFVFFGYGEMFFPQPSSPELNQLVPEYSGNLLKDYWQQPGRGIAESLLSQYAFPSRDSDKRWDTSSFRRDYFLRASSDSSPAVPTNPEDPPNVQVEKHDLILEHVWSLKELEAYLRTWSSAHTYDEKHGPGSDVVRSFVEKLTTTGYGKGRADGKERIGWEMGMISGRLVYFLRVLLLFSHASSLACSVRFKKSCFSKYPPFLLWFKSSCRPSSLVTNCPQSSLDFSSVLSLAGFEESEAARAPRPPDLGRRGAEDVAGFVVAAGSVVAEVVVAEHDSAVLSESAPNRESSFDVVLVDVPSGLEGGAVDGV
ncbi:BZ3500_MvSof-1268-A1-R1_Chr2-1g04389 [Microbotryum saponariae]|uniref:BZ3500_MvSof-1268-A1-R1_Chr2-1g04389 protein n=1 Tax=Microbotryum saponariae TaxID=289078 RepID=A0A2X0KCP6_9BASI|nr:BZ3500_MvSof-1268-A1-R1_Chr2-1g04389 [Microbotryum saponariae]SCZ91603.1 BZ3501_MvSof-1269-A2-R1_Chr2-1g04045 [Microbotryum saponariae]